ncbi:hypothetical protein E2B99_12545 [Alkanindiges illinoisensis]|uniref:RND transporter n=1 Tax=Alkanindiges illinoisensis TaxID=197183 RepID=A0A4Y7X9X3_9GAMM|nr:hypothetical protein E2B99_12545 [Alkanindiges illinoisensis]
MNFFQRKEQQIQALTGKGFVRLALSSLLLSGSAMATSAQAQTLCVFDLSGASGDYFAFMKDYALAAQKWSVMIDLKAYNKEEKAISK